MKAVVSVPTRIDRVEHNGPAMRDEFTHPQADRNNDGHDTFHAYSPYDDAGERPSRTKTPAWAGVCKVSIERLNLAAVF
jgi:hypothetical protein